MATLLDFSLIFYAYFSLRNCQYEVEQPELDVKHYYRWLNLRSQYSTTRFEFLAKFFIKHCPQFSEFWKVSITLLIWLKGQLISNKQIVKPWILPKMTKWVHFYYYLMCFCLFFAGSWRKKNLSNLPDLYSCNNITTTLIKFPAFFSLAFSPKRTII